MEVPATAGYDDDTGSSTGDNIPWEWPREKEKPKLARDSLEHPKLPDSRWYNNEEILLTWHKSYSESAEALERMIRDQARYPPILVAHIKGTHTSQSKKVEYVLKPAPALSPRGFFGERLPRSPRTYARQQMALQEKEIKNEEQDFHIKIDMTYLLAQLPSFSVPPSPRFAIPKHLRPQLHAVEDGVKTMRGGMTIPRRFPNSSSFRPGESALKFWFRDYVNKYTTLCRKRFIFKRKVTNFDTDKLNSMLEGLIRSTNYQGNIDIKFITTKSTIMVTTRSGFVDFLHIHSSGFWFWYYILGAILLRYSYEFRYLIQFNTKTRYPLFLLPFLIWFFFWPSLFLRIRDYQVMYATFPFGSDLKNASNPNSVQAQETYISGSRVVQRKGNYVVPAEQQFFADWKNAVRRGVRERFIGRMDTNYLMESNDLYEGVGTRFTRRGAMVKQGRANEVRGVDDKPWGRDEDLGVTWGGMANL